MTEDSAECVERLMDEGLAAGELDLPSLPQAAVKVVRIGTKESTGAEHLAAVIQTDPDLATHVLRIVASAAKRPAMPIVSLRHAVAWLGFDEVANIAFTVALQPRMLDVAGQRRKARQLWRHALASALWSRHLAHRAGSETGMLYLCGLLHDIGRVVTLGAANALAHDARLQLTDRDFERLIERFHDAVGRRVVGGWQLPDPVSTVATSWHSYASMSVARFDGTLIYVAHLLADYVLVDRSARARDAIAADPALGGLGLGSSHTAALFDAAADIDAELDRYLAG